jgi:SAM-dependent methyltransferase
VDAARHLSPADRVAALLRHLGIPRAHFLQGAAVAAALPGAVASLALVTPVAGEAPALRALAARGVPPGPPLIVHGDAGPLAAAAPGVLAAHPGAAAVVLRGYPSALWADTLAERAAEIAPALLDHLAAAERRDPLPPVAPPAGAGEVAGITYRARGSGPPLLLFPLYLAPSQWAPLLPALAARYCTLTLGGPHLGAVAGLERRAQGGYGDVLDVLAAAAAPPAGGTALDVGCGPGALARRLAAGPAPPAAVVGVDINAYLLGEAAALARGAGLAGRLTFARGDAAALPFPDASFDAALASTLLEEVDADRALAELARVVRPGGRVAVAVRAADLPLWDSLPLRPAVRAKLDRRPGSGAAPGGCADASLYRRFRALGLTAVALGPRLAVDHWEAAPPDLRAWITGPMEAALDAAELAEWRAAAAEAAAAGSFLWAQAFHCAVGTRPHAPARPGDRPNTP